MLSDFNDLVDVAIENFNSLNPCSNGICSLIALQYDPERHDGSCLNPCSNGICSLIYYRTEFRHFVDGLNPCSNGICSLINVGNLLT